MKGRRSRITWFFITDLLWIPHGVVCPCLATQKVTIIRPFFSYDTTFLRFNSSLYGIVGKKGVIINKRKETAKKKEEKKTKKLYTCRAIAKVTGM
jgi:hypothetical protein